MSTVFTIGHTKTSLKDFARRLQGAEVEAGLALR
jgi:hypothetical protein